MNAFLGTKHERTAEKQERRGDMPKKILCRDAIGCRTSPMTRIIVGYKTRYYQLPTIRK